MKKKVLIFGITGQDGSYLAELLLNKKNYKIHGISRGKNFDNLKKLKILNFLKIHIVKKDTIDQKIIKILNYDFDEIYFLGGQSNVNASFYYKEYETYLSQILPVQRVLEFLRKGKKKTKFLVSSSSEIFGYNKKKRVHINSKKTPLSPYALAKLTCYEIVKSYREMFNLPVFSIIYFNHESPLRKNNYVIKKTILGAKQIKSGKLKKLLLGNINIKRDWGWAPEFMEGTYKAMKSKQINDYLFATEKTVSLKKVVKEIFKSNNLNWKNYVGFNKKNFRKYDIKENYANINLTKKNLKWKPKYKIKEIIQRLNNTNIV